MKQYLDAEYVDLIPAHHNGLVRFPKVVEAVVSGPAALSRYLSQWPEFFNLEVATGDQLDVLGEWIGVNRFLPYNFTGIFFENDSTPALGWESGYWKGKYDPTSGLASLGDSDYRHLLYAMIMLNHWDGSMEGLQAIWDRFLPNEGLTRSFWRDQDENGHDLYWNDLSTWRESSGRISMLLDNQDMTISLGYIGTELTGIYGEFAKYGGQVVKPMAVRVRDFIVPNNFIDPIFSWDIQDSNFEGWDLGSWPIVTPLEQTITT